jgi:serine protease
VEFFRVVYCAVIKVACLAAAMLLLSACGGGGGGGGDSSNKSSANIPQGELRLSGSISVSAAVAADVDTNDPAVGVDGDNDSPETAQLIANPGMVAGYVNDPGTGESGPAFTQNDYDDFYRVFLLAGQTVSLQISDYDPNDPLAIDLDLVLLNIDSVVVDWLSGSTAGPVETLTVQASGEYILLVSVDAGGILEPPIPSLSGTGASNYVLVVSQASPSGTGPSFQLTSDFMADQAMVRFAPQQAESRQEFSTAAAVDADNQTGGGIELVRFASASALVAGEPQPGGRVLPGVIPRLIMPDELVEKAQTMGNIRQLLRSGTVEVAEPNFNRYAQFRPNDPGFEVQWHYPLINLPAAWDLTIGDPNITVAVIDTGVLTGHIDLNGPIVGGYDFISDVLNAGDGNGIDSDPNDPGDSGSFGFSSSFHGTHVAGTVAASTNNDEGVAGVAPDVKVMPVRALGRLGGASIDIIKSICFAAGLSDGPNCSGVPPNFRPVDVINMSLGGS